MKVDFIFITDVQKESSPYAVRRSRRPIRKLPFGSLLVGKVPHDRQLDSTSDFADALRGGLGILSISVFPGAGLLYLLRLLSTLTYAIAVLIALAALVFALCWRA
ncbi:hypothetical protein [Pendulispora albinea]|uniref:Uncharacterized protein n=1 Tax=Pendulispora albinea TaxID=2741071 RepID=A0ABZ2LMG2_9BACT